MSTTNLNYTIESSDLVYNVTDAEGVSTQVIYNLGDMAWVMTSMALVWLMIPGLGLFYSGLLRRKNALSMIFLSLAGIAVASFQWFFWGYSLAFSDGASPFIGNLWYFGFKGVYADPSIGSSRIPALLFAIYQCMFACITGVIAIGGFAERARIGPIMVFLFVWLTIVYCPIACWTWNSNGWSFILGGLDFAGGGPVHINSGTAALAIAIYLGKRRGYGTERLAYKPHNTAFCVVGTALLWFGWFGFNGGSALSANLRAVEALVVTNIAASTGGITWMLLDWRLERKFSAIGFCSGAISGLVAITPGSGYVSAYYAVVFGVVGAAGCNFATKLKYLINVDESLDVFASHGVGGMIGGILTGFFAETAYAAYDGLTEIPGGWINRNWVQMGYQIADLVAVFAYSLVMTTAILWIMHFIPGLRLRCSEEAEIVGMDDYYLGEFAVDYIGADPELRLTSDELDKHNTMSGSGLGEGSSTPTEAEMVHHGHNGEKYPAPGGGRVDQ